MADRLEARRKLLLFFGKGAVGWQPILKCKLAIALAKAGRTPHSRTITPRVSMSCRKWSNRSSETMSGFRVRLRRNTTKLMFSSFAALLELIEATVQFRSRAKKELNSVVSRNFYRRS